MEGGNVIYLILVMLDNLYIMLMEEEKLKLNEGKMVVVCVLYILKIKNKRIFRYLVGMENGKGCLFNIKFLRNRISIVINVIRVIF